MGSLSNHNSSTRKTSGKRLRRSLLILFSLLLLIRLFLLAPARVISSSMFPTLHVGDILLADKTCYGLRLPFTNTKILETGQPHRADIVLFLFPDKKHQVYLKRIIGLPGDVIILKGHSLFVNGRQVILKSTCMQETVTLNDKAHIFEQGKEILSGSSHAVLFDANLTARREQRSFEVPAENYFVLGDNRDHSIDSRSWGFVPEENFIGRPFLILFSWNTRTNSVAWTRVGMHVH